ncbi:MAG TPA: hypothetical protein VHU91_10520 [Mycobacteriales bacterium]|jgi:diadenosine tetraphosphate (Ap4A) HIT family hydrolase|nr:hypothetical protein [Mycobacteriales bacterium]
MDDVVEWCNAQLARTREGKNPRVIAELKSGWVVIGETQFLPGYCLLLSREPAAALAELALEAQTRFLADLALTGQAVHNVCGRLGDRFLRVNYEVLGNRWNYLHGHVYARYAWEPLPERLGSIHAYGPRRNDNEHRLDGRHQPLISALRAELRSLVGSSSHRAVGGAKLVAGDQAVG